MLLCSRKTAGLLALLLMAAAFALPARAADAESRAFTAAEKYFSDGLFKQAEKEFGDFVAKHPASPRVAQAILRQAQAALEQKKFSAAISLLGTNMASAAGIADQFQYWLGQVHFQARQFDQAANSFAVLISRFTNSTLRLDATLGEAQSRFELKQWPGVSELLQNPAGVFQRELGRAPESSAVLQGRLLLAEALLEQRAFDGAAQVAGSIPENSLPGEKKWRREYLRTKAQYGGQKLEAARASSSNLVALAGVVRQPVLEATSVALQAEILEALNLPDAAIAAYQQNQRPGVPPERLREAVFKTVVLLLGQGRITNAVNRMQEFLAEHPGENGSDMALVTLAELRLKQHQMWSTISTNAQPDPRLLPDAIEECGRLLRDYTNSPFVGNAQLVRGWALFAQGRGAESLAAFRAAAEALPWSEARAVARFKVADLEFQGREFTNAIRNYRRVLREYESLSRVQEELVPRARYQMVQAGREAGDLGAADEAMKPLLAEYPANGPAERTLLLYGQVMDELGRPDGARQVFSNFLARFPSSKLRADVELAIIRTCERERNWPEAIARYDRWVVTHTTNDLLPLAEFQRAMANFHAGRSTNALNLFTNFVTRFPANPLGARAQYWVGDFYYAQDQFVLAEQNYQLVYQYWPASDLSYQARLDAGRAALRRYSYDDATKYFTEIINNERSPASVVMLAYFAYGDAFLQRPMTNAVEKYSGALSIYAGVEQFATKAGTFAGDPLLARAWGQMGNCNFQLAGADPAKPAPARYEQALALYQKAAKAPFADVSTRCQAEVGTGRVLRQQARIALEEGRKADADGLIDTALNSFLAVVYSDREGETPDQLWVKEAGLDAAAILEEQGKWTPAQNLYLRLGEKIPPLKPTMEKRIEAAKLKAALEKN